MNNNLENNNLERSKTILECKNLTKRIGKKQILKNVGLEVKEGDILGFIGPNGAGKTTTIKLILGLQSITSGTVIINGFDITKGFERAMENVGAIVESPDLYMYMSGYRNLQLVANMYKNIDKKRIDEVVKIVGLQNRINDKVSKYSLGMRQRLGIAQAILHNPKLLVLDEPTNGLDPEGIKEMRDLLKKLAQNEHMGILISSHNLAELETFVNKVSIIKNGNVIENTAVETLKRSQMHSAYIFETENSQGVAQILQNINIQQIEIIDNNKIKINAPKEEIPQILKEIVLRNIKVYAVYEESLSLEEAFLSKTGGNEIE